MTTISPFRRSSSLHRQCGNCELRRSARNFQRAATLFQVRRLDFSIVYYLHRKWTTVIFYSLIKDFTYSLITVIFCSIYTTHIYKLSYRTVNNLSSQHLTNNICSMLKTTLPQRADDEVYIQWEADKRWRCTQLVHRSRSGSRSAPPHSLHYWGDTRRTGRLQDVLHSGY